MGQIQSAISSEPLDVPKITQLKRSLGDKLQSLSTLDEEILLLTPVEAVENEIVQADEIKELIYTALSKLEIALNPALISVVRTDPPAADPPHTEPSVIVTADPTTPGATPPA